MSTPKGYAGGTKLARTNAQYSTIEPVRLDQFGLSVLSHQFVYQVASLAVTSATVNTITTNNHGALQGDVIRFTSGVNSGREVKVYSVTTNVITLAEDLSTASSGADTYLVLRHKYPMVDSGGVLQVSASVTVPPMEYVLNGVNTNVTRDTVTPANNRPFPVQLLDTSGNLNTVTVGSSALPTGAATEATLSAQSAKLPATLGAKTIANSMAVNIASDQTVPISAVSLPLPTGAASLAKQPALGTAGTASADVITVQGIASMTALKVDGSAVTQPVSATALPLPTGAATETTLSAQSAKLPATLGQKAMSASMAVALASDQSAIPVSQSGTWTVQPGNTANTTAWLTRQAGKSFANAPVRNDYSSVNVTTAAYVQLVASTTSLTTEIEIFDSSGQTLALAVGGSGSEVNQIYIIPGGNGRIPLAIPASSRVSVKAISANATVGELDINFYS